jgi:hypothetical protein
MAGRREPMDLPDEDEGNRGRPAAASSGLRARLGPLPVWGWLLVAAIGSFAVAAGVTTAVVLKRRPAAPEVGPPAVAPPARTPPTAKAAPPPGPAVPTPLAEPPAPTAPPEAWEGDGIRVAPTFAVVLEDSLLLPVTVSTDDPRAKITFREWRTPFLGTKGATLRDEAGVVYAPVGFDEAIDGLIGPLLRERLRGEIGLGSGPVYADHPRVNMLIFERPTSAAQFLDLELAAANVGQQGVIRIRIPRAAWVRPRKN